MSRRAVPTPAKLLASVIYRDEGRFSEALRLLTERIGAVERVSDRFPFDFTDYYAREMGAPLARRFVVAAGPVARDALAAAKEAAEAIEAALAVGGRRTVNIDPGLLTDENFILATGKNYSHRVYLRDGIFADLALVYEKGGYRALPWTYPDYASDAVRAFLADVRAAHREARGRGAEGRPCPG
ncbi:MAG: DUF4416 family protein [Gemmatimonadota bacterium]